MTQTQPKELFLYKFGYWLLEFIWNLGFDDWDFNSKRR